MLQLPDKCPGCGDDNYEVCAEEAGPRETVFRCRCGAEVGGQSGMTLEEVSAAMGAPIAAPPAPRRRAAR